MGVVDERTRNMWGAPVGTVGAYLMGKHQAV